MFSELKSVGLFGIDSYMIEVEADISSGLPAFDIVGLPDAAVKESRDRVRAALKNCGVCSFRGRPKRTPCRFAAAIPSACRARMFALSFSATKEST